MLSITCRGEEFFIKDEVPVAFIEALQQSIPIIAKEWIKLDPKEPDDD
jgi:hypothetical protein